MASLQVKLGRTRKPKHGKGLTCRTQARYNDRSTRVHCRPTCGIDLHRWPLQTGRGNTGQPRARGRSGTRGGDLDSTEIWFRRMRAEDHHPRKSDGNNHNCGYAARSRSVKPCERPPRSACGPGTGCHLSRLVADTWSRMSVTRFSGAGFRRLFAASSRRERDFRSGYAS